MVEQARDWRWRIRSGAPGGRRGERGREVEDWRMILSFFVLSSRVAWLHGCTERSRCARPGKAEEIFFGASGQPAQGVVVASCRTKAGAGLPWPMGDAARPERRDGGPGLCGTRGIGRSRAKKKEKKMDAGCKVLY